MRRAVDAVVIGGGVIGTSVAYYLSKRKLKVALVERNDLASGASGACDKAIILQSKKPGIHLKLALKSVEIYKTLQEELEDNIDYHNAGGMILIETSQEMEAMQKFIKEQRKIGLQVEILDRKDAAKLQMGIAEHLQGATYSPQDSHVDPIGLTLALSRAAIKNGAEILLETEIIGIKIAENRVKGVKTTRGDIYTEVIINAAGAWASFIGKMVNLDIPIKPRRGQIVVTEPVPPFVRGEVLSAGYIVAKYNPTIMKDNNDPAVRLGVGLALSQTEKGNILIGATREFAGYNSCNTRQGIKEILKNAVRLVPRLKRVNMIRAFAGLRPYTPDSLPIIGEVKEIKGFFMAAGHEGDGIALSPVTGQMVADLITDDNTFIETAPLRLERFTE